MSSQSTCNVSMIQDGLVFKTADGKFQLKLGDRMFSDDDFMFLTHYIGYKFLWKQ